MRRTAIAAFCAVLLFATVPPQARAQSFLGGGLPIDAIRCDTMEGAVVHIHTHLQIFNRGKAVAIPAGVGIPQGASCLYWVHTHTDDGIIHIESPNTKKYTLGEFFDIWQQPLDTHHVAGVTARHALKVWVNGRVYTGDPRKIVLRDQEEIVIQIGPPFAKPSHYDWSKL